MSKRINVHFRELLIKHRQTIEDTARNADVGHHIVRACVDDKNIGLNKAHKICALGFKDGKGNAIPYSLDVIFPNPYLSNVKNRTSNRSKGGASRPASAEIS